MKARTSGSTWIPELDGLRGLAALTVALTHLFPDTWLNGFSTANMAVSFFFSLSAFLMSYLLTLEEMHDGKIRIAKFYLRRVFRIWPLYVATMIFIVVLAGPAGPFRGTSHVIEHMTLEWFWNLGLVPFLLFFNLNMSGFGFGPLVFDRIPHFFGVIWSINVEEKFYAVFPFLFLLFTKSKKASYIIIVCFGALLIRTFLMYYLGPGNPHGIPFSMYYFSLSYVEIFFLGAIAGRICAHNHIQNNSVINLIKSKYFGVVFILIIPIFGYYWHFSLWSPYLWWSSGAYMIMAAIFSSLLIWVFYNRTSIAAKLLRSSPFRVLGRLSFAIYLLHLPAFAIARYLLEIYEYGQVTPSPDSWIYESLRTIAIIAVLLLLSTLAHFCVERPFLSLKESFDSIAASGRWSSPMLDALTFARARINWGWISVVGPAAVVFSMMFVPGLLQ
ncbi:acyltransferase family protein, partial [Skermanella aerolata]